MTQETLKDRIRLRLEELGKTMAGASKEAGLNQAYIRQLLINENQHPTTDKLEKIAEVLETDVVWLLTGAGDKQKSKSAEVVNIWKRILDKNEEQAWLNMGRALGEKKSNTEQSE